MLEVALESGGSPDRIIWGGEEVSVETREDGGVPVSGDCYAREQVFAAEEETCVMSNFGQVHNGDGMGMEWE